MKNKDRAILVHGWLGLPYELTKLGRALEAMGFDVEYVRHYSLLGKFESAVQRFCAMPRHFLQNMPRKLSSSNPRTF
jgi:hypothetical protein